VNGRAAIPPFASSGRRVRAIWLACSLAALGTSYAEWQYDWSKRTDRYGKPAGVFLETPFPITEQTTNYVIETDEGLKTAHLGTKYFVDGGTGNDTNSGLSVGAAKRTIAAAIVAAGSGNKTILIRGAHADFDGVYPVTQWIYAKAGVDTEHRWILCGYGQERPMLDGSAGATRFIYGTGQTNAFVTIQRLKFQHCAETAVRPGGSPKQDADWNTIDVSFYDCDNLIETPNQLGDGSLYYFNVDHGWIHHVTSEHTKSHGIKVGNTIGGHDNTVEWCFVNGAGWYPGWDGPTNAWDQYPDGIDFPADTGGEFNEDIRCRYNIVKTTLYSAILIRRAKNFSFHHNEVYDSPKADQIAGACNHLYGKAQVVIVYGWTSGSVYDNIVRSQGMSNTVALLIDGMQDDSPVINVYNNQFYGNDGGVVVSDNVSGTVSILNNSIYLDSGIVANEKSGSGIYCQSTGDPIVNIENNVIRQDGSGYCIRRMSSYVPEHAYNLLYAPKGYVGVPPDGVGDSINQPVPWAAIPSGEYTAAAFSLTKSLPGKIESLYVDDFKGHKRVTWDKGCLDMLSPISAPRDLHLVSPGN